MVKRRGVKIPKTEGSVLRLVTLRGINTTVFYKNRKLACQQPLVEIPVAESLETGPIIVRTDRFSVSIPTGFYKEVLRSVLEVLGELS